MIKGMQDLMKGADNAQASKCDNELIQSTSNQKDNADKREQSEI